MREERPFDPGLQTERTLLAWRRTCLSLALASAVAVRLMAPPFAILAVVVGLAGFGVTIIAYAVAAHRYRMVHRSLTEAAVLPSGAPAIALLFGVALVLDAAGLAYVLSHART
jgi:uncharacterized membrane protein YidH (DUF202 family)